MINNLTVLCFSHVSKDAAQMAHWLVLCHCGNQFVTSGGTLRRGKIRSCGCLTPMLIGIARSRPLAVRFWEKVKKCRGCWEWLGTKIPNGYGQLWNEKRHHNAHRVSWQLHYGKIPKGLLVLHTCDNRSCVNPSHLFLGTNQDNTDDMFRKGRENPPRGNRQPLAKLSPTKVREIRGLVAQGITRRELAKLFHVSASSISRVASGEIWAFVS